MTAVHVSSRLKRLIQGALIQAGLLWASLALAYNSYKEVMRECAPLSRAIRDSIKDSFHWSILLFASLFILYGICKNKDKFASRRDCMIVITGYAVLANVIYFSKGIHIIIVQNIAVLYLTLFLFAWAGLKRFIVIDQIVKAEELVPPIIYRYFRQNMPRLRKYSKEKPSAPFIIGFMVLLMICAFLLIFKAEKAAEQLANIAYFCLVIGVGIEVYRMVRYGGGRDDGTR